MKKCIINEESITNEEVTVMPSVEVLERDRVDYLKRLQEYFDTLQRMDEEKAKEVSRANLVKCEILKENGDFTEFYQHIEVKVIKRGKKSV